MKKIENITSKIKQELEENEKKEKTLYDTSLESTRSINMKNFWNIHGLKKWIKYLKKERIIKIKANLDFILPKRNEYEIMIII